MTQVISGAGRTLVPVSSIAWLDVPALQLMLGALDSLGVALTEHGHMWTVGEREIYEQATAKIESAISSGGCMAIDSSVLVKCPSRMLWLEQPQECDRASGQLRESECSPSRVALPVSLGRESKICRCFVWIYSWCVSMCSIPKKAFSTSNENKMSHHWRGRTWRRDVRLESWKTWAYAGQWLAPSLC